MTMVALAVRSEGDEASQDDAVTLAGLPVAPLELRERADRATIVIPERHPGLKSTAWIHTKGQASKPARSVRHPPVYTC